jgi:hypothetical protein
MCIDRSQELLFGITGTARWANGHPHDLIDAATGSNARTQ